MIVRTFNITNKKPIIIGVAGGSCSGKTSVVNCIMDRFGDSVSIIKQDSYYNNVPSTIDPSSVNFDDPSSIEWDLLVKNLNKIKNGNEIYEPIYDFKTHKRMEETIKIVPSGVIIIEGILIFHIEKIVEMCDYKIYINADSDVRYRRRRDRDQKDRGRSMESIDYQWDKYVKPCHNKYVEPTQKCADVTLHNDNCKQKINQDEIPGLDMLITYIKAIIMK